MTDQPPEETPAIPANESTEPRAAGEGETTENGQLETCPAPEEPAKPARTKNKSSRNAFFSVLKFVVTLASGVIGGGYLASYVLESEYKQIISQLRSDHRISLSQVQDERRACQSNLSDEKRAKDERMERAMEDLTESCKNNMEKVQSKADERELACHADTERLMKEVHRAYRDANLGLQEASERLRALNDQHDGVAKELAHVETKKQLVEQQLEESTRQLDAVSGELRHTDAKLQEARKELDAAIEELDRRDAERAECDETHRKMHDCSKDLEDIQARADDDLEHCNALLEEATGNPDSAAKLAEHLQSCQSSLISTDDKFSQCQDQFESVLQELDEALRENNQSVGALNSAEEEGRRLSREVLTLEERLEGMNGRLDEMDVAVTDCERQKEVWKDQLETMIDKIKIRSRNEVLEYFGPGPHRAELTLQLPSSPTTETIVLELAPVDLMPHSVDIFLRLLHEQLYVGGTFMLARQHIVVAGPVDTYDPENNQQLQQRMLEEGYFPNGALLFIEHNEKYPHLPYTLGFNTVGGPVFYVNLMDNSESHGPRQTTGMVGDPCFAKVVDGIDVIQKITELPMLDDNSLVSPVYIVETRVLMPEDEEEQSVEERFDGGQIETLTAM